MSQICRLAVLLATIFLGCLGVANASLVLTNTSVADQKTITDPGGCVGGCIPLGETGYLVNDVAPNITVTAGYYTFTYLGAGDSADNNKFTVTGTGGGTFCSQSFTGCNGGVVSATGASFTMFLSAGDIPFAYTANIAGDGTGGCGLTDSSTTNALPSTGCADYFVGMGNSTVTPGLIGPGQFGYIGLTDGTFPGDSDFQDLGVRVQAAPEPASMALLASGLIGLGFAARRKTR